MHVDHVSLLRIYLTIDLELLKQFIRVPTKTAVWGTSRELGMYLLLRNLPIRIRGQLTTGRGARRYTLLRIPLPEKSSFWTTQGDLNGKPSSNLEVLEK